MLFGYLVNSLSRQPGLQPRACGGAGTRPSRGRRPRAHHVHPITAPAWPAASAAPGSAVTVVPNYSSFFLRTLCCAARCNLLNGFIPIFTHNIVDLLTVRNTTLPVAVPPPEELKIGKINQGPALRSPLFSEREGSALFLSPDKNACFLIPSFHSGFGSLEENETPVLLGVSLTILIITRNNF